MFKKHIPERQGRRTFYTTGLLCLLLLFSVAQTVAIAEEKKAPKPPKINAQALAAMLQSFDKVEVQEFSWGWIRWLMNAKLDPKAEMTLGIVQLNAGESNPLHQHPNCEEILYMLSGCCEHRIGDQTVVLKKGDTLRIPTGVPHAAKVIGKENMQAVIVYSSGERQFELVEE